MDLIYFEDQVFDKIGGKANVLQKGIYENCTFVNCDLSNVCLNEFNFTECEFKSCNLSIAKLLKTVFQQVSFVDCKLLALLFENCSEFLFSVTFDKCILNHSSFFKQRLKKTIFKNCTLHQVDFSECDLSAAVFDNCDLQEAIFENTILEKVDFRSAFNYSINPEVNQLKKAKFSLQQISGLLHKYEIEIEK